jgi:predicted phosphodiesterase
MTRIAVLADIHGNMPALEAVIEDIAGQQVDEVLVGGDLVGRGPQGSRVIERIRGQGWPSVRGNHEDYLLTFRRGEVPPDWLEADQWSAARWMAADLSDEDVHYLESLPFSLHSRELPQIHLVHASPQSNSDGIGPWTPARKMQQHWDSIPESTLVCAHTHRPLHRRFGDGDIVNVGSVGLPFNRDRRAQYALFTQENAGLSFEFRQVEYDLGKILDIYEKSGFLAEGGVTAQLLILELENAQPYLVPFLQWAATLNVPATPEQIGGFRDFYDPDEPIGCFFERLEQLSGKGRIGWNSNG